MYFLRSNHSIRYHLHMLTSRRVFASGLAALVASVPIALKSQSAYGQQPGEPWRIGVLLVGFSIDSKDAQAFRRGLRDAGYTEGRDVVIEWRSAKGDYAQIPRLVADLVQHKVDVIVVDGTNAARAAKQATSAIPIVMAVVSDPVESGVVVSLAHPGGNVTGLSVMLIDVSVKRLQLLKETIPRLTRVAVLWNPDAASHLKTIEELKAAAPALSIKLSFVGIRRFEEIRPAFSAMTQAHAEALYVLGDAFLYSHRMTQLELASKARLPVIFPIRQAVEEGGLMSYGPDFGDLFRRSAGYVDKILKGAKPSDLPIEQPTKFEFVVNLKTAKALKINIAESILRQADEVIR